MDPHDSNHASGHGGARPGVASSEGAAEANLEQAQLHLDPHEAAEAKLLRDHRYHTETIPRLRSLGLLVGAALLTVHNLLVVEAPPARAALDFLFIAGPYAALSWFLLRRYFGRTGRLHLGDLFLALDVPLLAYIVHLSGDEVSLLVPLVFARVIDQAFHSVKRCLIALHSAPVIVVVTLVLSQVVDGNAIDWRLAWAKILATYVAFLYVAFVSRTAEKIRGRLRNAVYVGRRLVRDLRQSSEDLMREKDRAEDALQVRSAFLANLSHDVRTPLAGILGSVELALQRSPDAELADLLSTTQGSAEALLHCLNDLLDLSKIEAGNLQLDDEPFELEERLGSALRALVPQAESKGLRLTCSFAPDVPRTIYGDRLRFGQILNHLVGNAIKFTDAGEIVVDVQRACDDERVVEIAICDTGRGIGPDQIDDVFGAYFQVDQSLGRRSGGKGIGLSLSRELARAMGGDITVTSAEGHGCVFRVRLAIGDDSEPAGAEGPLTGYRFAVVSDSVEARANRAEVLLRAGASLVDLDSDPEAEFDVALVEASVAADSLTSLPARVLERAILISSQAQAGLIPVELHDRPRVRLPLLPRELARLLSLESVPSLARDSAPAEPAAPVRRVLLVEDHPVNRKLALHHLSRWGHQVTVAEDGLQAVGCWAPGRFDVILMDIQMPNMDGIEATRRIRELERGGSRTPIYAVTANALRDDVERSFEAGMDKHLTKPIDFVGLRTMLETLDAGAHA